MFQTVTKHLFVYLHTITLTLAKGNFLFLRAQVKSRGRLAVWANNRRLLFRIYSTRLLQKVIDFTLDFEEADEWTGKVLVFSEL